MVGGVGEILFSAVTTFVGASEGQFVDGVSNGELAGYLNLGGSFFGSPRQDQNTGETARKTASVVDTTPSIFGGDKFKNGAVTGAFGRLFNDLGTSDNRSVCTENGRCVGYGEDKKLVPTGEVRKEWEGSENIRWSEALPVDSVIEYFTKRPLPSLTVQFGQERQFYSYEYQEVYEEYQYTHDNWGLSGEQTKIYTGNTRRGNRVWYRSSSVTNTRKWQRYCAGG